MTTWVTGARGFIGRHVARAAAARGQVVIGIGHGAWPEPAFKHWGLVEWRNGAISHDNLDALAASHGVPDRVVHLAGGSAVGPSFVQPAEDFRRSVEGSAMLAEWLRLHAPRARVVMASSAAVYGAGHEGPIAESAVCAPFSPYGFHKRMAELVFESSARSFALQVAVVRLFSVYGPGLRKQLLWDVCGRLAQRPAALALGGTGAERRDWLHVDDAASLLLAAVDAAGTSCPVFNGGTGHGTRVAEVAAALTAAWQQPSLPVSFSGIGRAGDPVSLVAAPSAGRMLGWQPAKHWAVGMAEYVAWYQQAAREPAA